MHRPIVLLAREYRQTQKEHVNGEASLLVTFKKGTTMEHYIVYHNPDTMGYPVSEVQTFSVFTNKAVTDVRGSRIWLIGGKGKPRTYFLWGYFVADDVVPAKKADFRNCITGSKGQRLQPMPQVDDEEWFDDFKRSLSNFSLGFQRITNERYIRGLKSVVAQVK